MLPSPSVSVGRTPTCRRLARPVSSWTYRAGLSETASERRGTFTGQCCCRCEQVTPPTTPRAGRNSRDAFLRRFLGEEETQCFSTTWSLAPPLSRIATPPALSLPGPFVARCCHPTLAA